MSIDTSKIIHAPVGGGRYTVTAPIVKEDYGLQLQIEGVDLPSSYQVDFSNSEHGGTSTTMISTSNRVRIPTEFIKSGKDIFAFLYIVGSNYGRTVYKFRIPNKLRPDRTNVAPDPEEQSVIDQAISALNTAVAQTAQDVIDADASAQSASADAERAEEARTDARNYATQAEQARDDAQTYANNASASATASAQSASQSAQIKSDVEDMVDDAQGYAQSASASAQSASGYASSAQTSASTASTKASEASTSAQTASAKASESAQSASQALSYKTDAESAKTASQTAQGLAESARDGAITAKTAAETAQGKAEAAQAAAESVAESIPSDYSQLSEDVSDLKEDLTPIVNKFGGYVEKTESVILDNTYGLYINPHGVISTISGNYGLKKGQVEEGETYLITASSNWSNPFYAWYDQNDNLISLGTLSAGGSAYSSIIDEEVVAPEGAVYICINWNTASVEGEAKHYLGVQLAGKWHNKKWVCVGDSLTEVNIRTDKHYFDYVAEATGIEVINMGVSGTGYKNPNGVNDPFYSRVLNVPIDADVVTIFGSFNDGATDLGTADDTGTSTIGGCINTTLDNLYSVIPTVQLGIVSPTPWDGANPYDHPWANAYVELLEAICKKRSIPFLNLYYESNLRPWDSTFRTLAYSKDDGNGVHPDETGHKIIAPKFNAFLESLLL